MPAVRFMLFVIYFSKKAQYNCWKEFGFFSHRESDNTYINQKIQRCYQVFEKSLTFFNALREEQV